MGREYEERAGENAGGAEEMQVIVKHFCTTNALYCSRAWPFPVMDLIDLQLLMQHSPPDEQVMLTVTVIPTRFL